MTNHTEVLDALSDVRDPELDEPITDLGFVSELEIDGDGVFVRLRLPTYFCAPNFAYLMVADAREAVLSMPGVRRAWVVLDDHYASDEINGGVNEEKGFDGAFPDETESPDLEELRTIFRRKSFVARQEKLCRALLAQGRSPGQLAETRLGKVPRSRSTWNAGGSWGWRSHRRLLCSSIRTARGCPETPSSSTSGSPGR